MNIIFTIYKFCGVQFTLLLSSRLLSVLSGFSLIWLKEEEKKELYIRHIHIVLQYKGFGLIVKHRGDQ